MARLIIQFRCLCIFVRDKANGRMHVLTPTTCACGHDEHEAFLVFPKEGGSLNAEGLFRQPGEAGKLDFIRMEGFAMTLPGNGKPADLTLQTSVVDLNHVTRKPLARALVDGPRDRRITSRVTFPSGRMADPKVPAFWHFAGKRKLGLARDVSWVVDDVEVDGDTFPVSVLPFGEGEEPKADSPIVVADVPKNQDGDFVLAFQHGMRGDFGRPLDLVDPGRAIRHFRAYYGLYDGAGSPPLPKFVTTVDEGSVGCVLGGGTVHP